MLIWKPSDTGINGTSLKSTGEKPATLVIEGDNSFQYTAWLQIVTTGMSAAGQASWIVDVFDSIGASTKIGRVTAITTVDLTGTDTTTYASFTFGGAGCGSNNGTTLDAGQALKAVPFFRIILNVTVAADGTTSVGNLYITGREFKRGLD